MYQILCPDEVEARHKVIGSRTPATYRRASPWLTAEDRAVLEMAASGVSHRLIASVVGMTPGTVSRRIGALSRRLKSPVVQYLADPNCPLDSETLRIARLHLITGRSIREIARVTGVSFTTARARVVFAQGMCRGFTAGVRAGV